MPANRDTFLEKGDILDSPKLNPFKPTIKAWEKFQTTFSEKKKTKRKKKRRKHTRLKKRKNKKTKRKKQKERKKKKKNKKCV